MDYKGIKCWQLKDMAKAMGADKVKATETLCKEIELVRTMQNVRKDVAKQLASERPYEPYHCDPKQVEKMGELGSPFALKAKAELVELCFKKLGKVILEKAVPTMRGYCMVKRSYEGIKKYGVKDPELDKLMEQAAKACDK